VDPGKHWENTEGARTKAEPLQLRAQ
jgi:hypothetical protein